MIFSRQLFETGARALVFIASFILFLVLRPAFPLESDWLGCVAALADSEAVMPWGHPIWTAMAWILTKLPLPWSVSVPVLNCFFGAICIALMFELMMRQKFVHANRPALDARARCIAAAVGCFAVVLSVRLPQATAAMLPSMVGMALFLASLVISSGWHDDRRRWRLFFTSFLSGASLAELPSLAWLVLLHGLVWVVRFLRLYAQQHASPRRSSIKKGPLDGGSIVTIVTGLVALNARLIAGSAVCLIAGFIPMVASVFVFLSHQDGTEPMREQFLAILAAIIYPAFRDAVFFLPKHGWIFVLFLGLIPGLVILSQRMDRSPSFKANPNSRRNREARVWHLAGFIFRMAVYVTVFVVIIVILLTQERWSALDLLSLDAGLGLVFWIAWWIGRWTGSLYVVAGHGMDAQASPRKLRRNLPPLLATVFVALLICYSFHGHRFQGEIPAARWRLAKEIVAQLQQRGWLVSEGGMDALVLAAANRAGVPLKVINVSNAHDSNYRKLLASRLPASALRKLCEKDLRAMLTLWILRNPSSALSSVAVLRDGAYWQSSGNTYIPAGVLYLGAATTNEPDPDLVWQKNENTWRSLSPPPGTEIAEHAAKVANDCGVWMLRHARTNLAARAFSQALSFDPANVCARLNLVSVDQSTIDAATQAVAKIIASPEMSNRLKFLRNSMGFLIEPQRWVTNGWAWAHTGSLDPASPQLSDAKRQVLRLLAEGQDAEREGDMRTARELFERAFATGAGVAALQDLLILDLRTEDLGAVARHASLILEDYPDHALANYALGYFHFMNNKLDLAESSLRCSVNSVPTSYAWAELAQVLWAKNQTDQALAASDKAIALCEVQANAWRIKGLVLARRGDLANARNALLAAVKCNPKDDEARIALTALPASR